MSARDSKATVLVWAPTASERRALAERCERENARVAAAAANGTMVLRRLALSDVDAVVVAETVEDSEREATRAEALRQEYRARFIRTDGRHLMIPARTVRFSRPLERPLPKPSAPRPTPSASEAPRSQALPSVKTRAVVISTSTGGPKALATVLAQLPGDFPLPILIMQHIPEGFAGQLADNLSARSRIPVRVGEEGALVRPGVAWLAPGDFHMAVRRDKAHVRVSLNRGPKVNNCRPAGDVLLESAVSVWRDSLLSVVLTGMGNDATQGCRLVRDAGGLVIAQDEATSVVWGMPGSVVREELAQLVLPLNDVAHVINRRARARDPKLNAPAASSAAPLQERDAS